ncbi:DUF3426 domain-containing protein [Acinetobacter cumulans]|uniref:DUF3426 domain-containing protein n=1 Tax=Acinetobacter cumulans TaxID=2136182 RepID=A0A498CV92_9GAMM|nr:DUF3426 domain-containing protein [Acinetobacter cumulans]RLL34576.1 DUF3426 domain-containing protein [Acinetobacter cumulans]
MNNKQTFCPSCSTTYRISVAQLTISQGMVCCAKCSHTFNALSHLVDVQSDNVQMFNAVEKKPAPISAEPIDVAQINLEADQAEIATNIYSNSLLAIFDQKVENSNIDLRTYLNNLNYFSTDPIGNFPALNWSENTEVEKKRSVLSYIGWTTVNVLLFSVLLFQFFWFNPQYLKNSPIMSSAFNGICEVFTCSKLEEHYNLVNLKKVRVKADGEDQVLFRGEIVNHHTRSLLLPIIRVELKHNGQEFAVYNIQPKDYLTDSLTGIQRIPSNTPYNFNFKLSHARKSFDSYTLEIIRP